MLSDNPQSELWMDDSVYPYYASLEQSDNQLQILTSQSDPGRLLAEPAGYQKTLQTVRDWLSNHGPRLYPTPIEKAELVVSAGCSERQLNICFRNLRARESHCTSFLSQSFYSTDDVSSVRRSYQRA